MTFGVELYRGCAGCDDVLCRAAPWLASYAGCNAMMYCCSPTLQALKPQSAHTTISGLVECCCFTSTETVGLLGTGAQDGHLDFHTQLLSSAERLVEVLLYVHRNRRLIRDESPGRPPRLSHTQLLSPEYTRLPQTRLLIQRGKNTRRLRARLCQTDGGVCVNPPQRSVSTCRLPVENSKPYIRRPPAHPLSGLHPTPAIRKANVRHPFDDGII